MVKVHIIGSGKWGNVLKKNIENLNESQSLQNENVHLFTLDVQSLYPSIKPELALQAIRETLATDKTIPKEIKNSTSTVR